MRTRPARRSIHEPAWDRIQEEERKDYADAQRDADRVAAVVDHPALAGFGTVAGGVLLGLLVWPLAYRRYGREPDVPGTAIEYLPDPPDDAPPGVAQALTTQADSGGGGDRLAATFLDLIVRGRFVARVGDTDDGPDLLLEQGDRSVHVESWEKPLIEIVESVLPEDGSVAIPLGDMSKQLKELSTSKRETNASRKSSFHRQARRAHRRGGAAVRAADGALDRARARRRRLRPGRHPRHRRAREVRRRRHLHAAPAGADRVRALRRPA